MSGIDETILARIEKQHAAGVTSAEILDVFATHGVTLSEATLRKYVQLGLLPRSVRVGTKGKHQGSKGLYPVRVVRQHFVQTGRREGDYVALQQGVRAGDEVVIAGAFKLRNGAPVVVTDHAVPTAQLRPRLENR